MVLSGHVWIARKKEGIRPERAVVAETESRASAWLDDQCAADPHIEETETEEYNKTVWVDQDDSVVGHIQRVPTKVQYEQMEAKHSVDRTEAELREQEAGVLE
jgi:hypothetical protein